ncbi:MAG: patatin-like phospholipase family protein [Elusimicrobia bacterium]|nr:patatin-like phospholipase family protein [Elusimicrobiota bacterium]
MTPPGKTALVLSGGGSRGAAEVGFYRALRELGVGVDFIVGASVGAINGAFIASGLEWSAMRGLWRDFARRRPFRLNWRLLLSPFAEDGLLDAQGLHRFLSDSLPTTRFESLPVPLTVVATSLQDMAAVYLERRGDLLQALMASTALPLYFPPVRVAGRQLVDGGVADNAPIAAAIARGATRVYCFRCDCDAEAERPVRGWLDVHATAFRVAMKQRLLRELDGCRSRAELVVVDSCLLASPGLLDFSRSEELMEQAYAVSLARLRAA